MARSPQLSPEALRAIEAAPSIGISAASCWEVALLATKGRIQFELPPAEWVQVALGEPGVVALPLDPEVAVEAALLAAPFPRDPADRFIYASAKRRAAILVTRDRRIRDYDPRGTLW